MRRFWDISTALPLEVVGRKIVTAVTLLESGKLLCTGIFQVFDLQMGRKSEVEGIILVLLESPHSLPYNICETNTGAFVCQLAVSVTFANLYKPACFMRLAYG